MDAIKLIKQHHTQVDELFEEFKSYGDVADSNMSELFARIADIIAAHATMEERLFYPSVYVGPTESKLREAVEEHLAVKRVIADLLDLEPADEQFKAKMKVLEDLFEHHVQEEEQTLLPSVQKLFSKQELDAMGDEMEQLFSELIQTEPRRELPGETAEAAPLT
jgi:hemerythrin superfamily protein